MAELMKESWNEEELLRDSLDSVDESVISLGATDEMKPVETMEEMVGELAAGSHDSRATLLTERIKSAESSRKGQNMTDSNNEVKKHTVLKQSKRNGIVLNKTVPTKGRPKMSYSEMYISRLQRQKPSQKPSQVNDKKELNRGDMSGISPREVENPLMQSGQEAIDEPGQFKENDFKNGNVSDTHLQYGNTMNSAGYTDLHANSKHAQLVDSGVNDKPVDGHGKLEWTNHNNTSIARQSSDYIMPNSDVISNNDYNLFNQGLSNSHHKSSLRERQGNFDPLLYNPQDVNLSQYLPPIQTIPVYSAPAAVQTYYAGDHQYEIPYRPISLCTSGPGNTYSRYHKHNDSMTSASSSATTKSGAASYSSIHAKQHTGTYEPYTLNDYKRLKHTKPGGLGPNTNSEEYKQKVKKAMRQKEYAAVIRQKHNFDNLSERKKPSTSTQEKSSKIQEADARRKKALQYAKAVPKPTTTKTHTLKVQAKPNNEGPRTLIDILRQRHEKEREAIDAVRKDLEAKLKTR